MPREMIPDTENPDHPPPGAIATLSTRQMTAIKIITAAILGSALLSGCATAVGAGAVLGVATAQERGLGNAITDTRIHAAILAAWLAHDPEIIRRFKRQSRGGPGSPDRVRGFIGQTISKPSG